MKFRITFLILSLVLYSSISAQEEVDSVNNPKDTISNINQEKSDLQDFANLSEIKEDVAEDTISNDSINSEVVENDSVSKETEIVEEDEDIAELDSMEQDSKFGKISVTTKPESTSLYFDGNLIGVTPVTIDSILPGKHTIKLKKNGYYVKKATLNIKEGSSSDINFDLIKPATLKIVSTPENAVISLNGKMVGQTPFDNSKLKPGKYEISIQSPGFAAQDTTLNLTSGSIDSLFFTFGEPVDTVQEADTESSEGEPQEKSRIEKVLNKVAIGIFAAFTALILLIELNHNNE